MKKVGLAAFEDKRAAFNNLSSDILQKDAEQLSTQLSVFQSALSYFAVEHAKEIKTNTNFRSEFAKMCTAIGVDPLASSSSNKKGSLWASVLGSDVNDFYFELGIRIIEMCRLTRDLNGGLISVVEVQTRLADKSLQLNPRQVTVDDIELAVKSLGVLGNGFELVRIDGCKHAMIRSVPSELSTDQASILSACEVLGYVTLSMLRDNLKWTPARSTAALNDMVAAGLVWVDTQGVESEYWAPQWMER
jgi:ESCRT-II complex subunit VPS22